MIIKITIKLQMFAANNIDVFYGINFLATKS